MNINDILALGQAHISEEAELVIEDSWSQGRTVYGGLSTALLFQAIKERSEIVRRVQWHKPA